jgi:hypothetical protein
VPPGPNRRPALKKSVTDYDTVIAKTVEERLAVLYAALEVLDEKDELCERIVSFLCRIVDLGAKPVPHAGMSREELLQIWADADGAIAEFNALAIAARKLIQ